MLIKFLHVKHKQALRPLLMLKKDESLPFSKACYFHSYQPKNPNYVSIDDQGDKIMPPVSSGLAFVTRKSGGEILSFTERVMPNRAPAQFAAGNFRRSHQPQHDFCGWIRGFGQSQSFSLRCEITVPLKQEKMRPKQNGGPPRWCIQTH